MVGDFLNNITEGVKQGVIDGIREGLIKFVTWLGTSILAGSYWICLLVCVIALILYISGFKKSGKYVGLSFLLFFILQCIKVVV